jgi:hypothetical protein
MKFGPRRTEAEVAAVRLARVKRKPKALQCLTHKVSNSSNSIYFDKGADEIELQCRAPLRLYARPVPAIVRFRPIKNRINVEKHNLLYIMPASA